jgi:hypothetical protein
VFAHENGPRFSVVNGAKRSRISPTFFSRAAAPSSALAAPRSGERAS